jgi:hypothetical protein
MSVDMAGRVFSALKAEPGLCAIHLAGGEATLRLDALLEVVRLADGMGIPMAYLETNAAWCADRATTREKLDALRQAGLPGLLVSCSMFHNEFVPFARTRTCIEEGTQVFGRHNVMVWLPHLYETLASLPDEKATHTLEEFCAHTGMRLDNPEVPELYSVIPGGRAPEALRNCYVPQPAAAFRGGRCHDLLRTTSHFHIDVYGNLFTGLCAGIAPGNIDDLHPAITPEAFPVFSTLCAEGPHGLMTMAAERHGFEPRDDGYAGKCDLCYHVRRHLHATGDYPELQPADYYED